MAVSDDDDIREYVRDSLIEHTELHHIGLTAAEATQKVEEHDEMVSSVERIIDLLEGKPVLDLGHNVVARSGGMISKQTTMADHIDTIYDRTNGGVKVTNIVNPAWTRNQKIGIAGLAITVVFAALPGFVGFLHWLAEWWVL